jgi:hypothetical protein
MSNNKTFINQYLDESFEKYIKPVVENDTNFYRIFDNNCDNDRVVINGKLEKIVNQPKNFNNFLNIDLSYGNIVHIPMLNNIYIEYLTTRQMVNIKDLNSINQILKLDSNDVKFLSVKRNKNIIYQDIIIQTNKTIIIIQLYNFKIPVEGITHGAFIIYQNDYNNNNQNNTIYYTKNNSKLIIDNILDTKKIINSKKKIQQYSSI